MIDRDKVLVGLESCADRTGALCRTCPYDFVHNEYCMGDMAQDALELIERTPEQKHGHWIRLPGFKPDWKCSVCNGYYFGDPRMFKFCPECGAIMDEEVPE